MSKIPHLPIRLSSPATVRRKALTTLNRTWKNRALSISISTDDSEDDEAVASYNATEQARHPSSFRECGQTLKDVVRSPQKARSPPRATLLHSACASSLSGSSTSSPNKASKLMANVKTPRSNGIKQKGTGCPSPRQGQVSPVASRSRDGSSSSRAPNVQRSSALSAVASGLSQRDNAIPRAMASPLRMFGALLGLTPPKNSVGMVHQLTLVRQFAGIFRW